METLFSFIAFFSFAGLVAGLIKPKIFSRFVKEVPKRKIIALVFGGAMILSGLLGEAVAPDKTEVIDDQNNQVVARQVSQPDNNQEQEVVEKENKESETSEDLSDNQADKSVQNEPEQTVNTSQESQPQQTTQPTSQLYSVVKVVDGDTIKVDINGTTETLRLIGINTPETVDPRKPVECFGIEASNRAKELLTNKKVILEPDPSQGERGIYGRLLRYVWLEDGTFYNKQMILDGYANEYTYNTPYKYQNEFKQAEKEARENKRGLWADDACANYVDSSTEDSSSQTDQEQSSGKYYTSSYHTATYYYPAECDAWKGLSEKYLESYDSLEALLQVYPLKTLSPQCQ